MRKVARIGLKIFVRRELRGVYENRNDNMIGRFARAAHELVD